jgi:hypothetical protein
MLVTHGLDEILEQPQARVPEGSEAAQIVDR